MPLASSLTGNWLLTREAWNWLDKVVGGLPLARLVGFIQTRRMQLMFINAAVCSPTETVGEFQFVAYTGGNIAENYRRIMSLGEAQAELETLAAKYAWPPMMMDEPYPHRPARLANFGE